MPTRSGGSGDSVVLSTENAMSSREKKIIHLGDHLPYELLMFRHAYQRALEERYQLDWNACYESFALHSRILFNFLMNEDSANNFKAKEFADFTGNNDAKVRRLINQDLHWQVFHFGKQRKSEDEEKVGREERKIIFEWVEQNFTEFEKALANTDFAQYWNRERARPDKVREEFLRARESETVVNALGPAQASAGSLQTIGWTGPSGRQGGQ
jgi:hypothetical protein